MKIGRDGVTQLEDDEEDTTVAPVETEEQKTERLAAEEAERLAAEGEETDEEKAARVEAERVAAEAAESEVVVTIGEEPPPSEEDDAKAPEWVRELRKSHRELTRRNRELEEQAKSKTPAPEQVVVGEKPKLEDFDYDAEKFGAELEKWHERKRKADDANAKRQDDEKAAKAAWQSTLDAYGAAKAKLKVKDADDAEATAQEILSVTQQGVILAGADNPALVVYALGKNPKKAKELASIKNPVKFAFAVAKLETQVKATPRKAPPPERIVVGSASRSGTIDSHLEKLRAEADRTGDYSKVTAYRREKRQKAS